MTVVDEKSRVPPLDEAAIARLAGALDRPGVVAASVIGSQARGSAGPLSDIDLGVWHDPELGGSERARLQLDLIGAAVEALGTDEVDVVMLNGASPLMRHRAIRDGRRFLEHDPVNRVRLEARGLIEYLDTEPLRGELSRGVRKSLKEGTFGRPRKH